jgi:hypothetical protein
MAHTSYADPVDRKVAIIGVRLDVGQKERF